MKRFATEEHQAITTIPPIARIVPIRVEVELAIITVHIEHVPVTVRKYV